MKKFLLLICICFALADAYSQEVVLNEVYPDPSTGRSEYIELYNTTSNPINLDCYTIISYYKENGGGAWVLNLPNVTIQPFGHIVFAGGFPLVYRKVQGLPLTYPSLANPYPPSGQNLYSWNSNNPLTGLGTTGSLRNYTRSGNSLVPGSATTTNDLIPISTGNTAAVALMLWKGNDLSNALFTNSDVPNGSSAVLSLAPLNIPFLEDEGIDDCPANGTLVFSTISAPEVEVAAITSAPGTDNGYARLRDGFCGQWAKTQNDPEFNPGWPNSNQPPIDASTAVTIAGFASGCGTLSGGTQTSWNLSVGISQTGLLPGVYRVYGDDNRSSTLNVGDGLVIEGTIPSTTPVSLPGIAIKTGSAAIVQVITASGCIVVTKLLPTECAALPVRLKSFTANRNHSDVEVKWTTATEQNNRGFELQKLVGAAGWQKVAFIASKADGGNSTSDISYSYNDLNTTNGVTQYRLLQTDFDGQLKYSEIRSVRGEGQAIKLLVFPNPTNNGNVKVVFEDASGSRDVSLMDINGRTVKQWKNVTNNTLQIENLVSGMYNLRVINRQTGEQTIEKIIVSKK